MRPAADRPAPPCCQFLESRLQSRSAEAHFAVPARATRPIGGGGKEARQMDHTLPACLPACLLAGQRRPRTQMSNVSIQIIGLMFIDGCGPRPFKRASQPASQPPARRWPNGLLGAFVSRQLASERALDSPRWIGPRPFLSAESAPRWPSAWRRRRRRPSLVQYDDGPIKAAAFAGQVAGATAHLYARWPV